MTSEDDPYGAINFGEFRKYMQNKQSKLKQQQHDLGNQTSQQLPQIFSGTSIYINGYCYPPTSELRTMILQHGGDYQHYLKKTSVTHIIATNLTNAKLNEFRAYKIVKPNWIVESIKAQKLLPWQNYRLSLTSTKVAQKELTFAAPSGERLNASILANNWNRQASTANPDFIKRYYETSRLHYLSIWKHELKEIVSELQKTYNKRPVKTKSSARVVMHIDFDCFFASVGMKDRSHLKDCPVAVSHSKEVNENSSSDIASCNYVARSYGIRNGMTIGAAKGLCPDLKVIPYEFEKYKAISKIFYNIVFQYADEMQAVSVDEALLEVGSYITVDDQKETLAIEIRNKILQATGCEVSVGIGPNILLARMATRKAKPAGHYVCKTSRDMEELLSSQNVTDLPGVGYSIMEKLKEMNVTVISDVKKIPLQELQTKLGNKIGQTLYNFSRGIDDRPLNTNQRRQSVSAEVNWGVRFENEENEKSFVEGLSKEVSDRLKKHQILKRKQDASEAVKHLGHGSVDSFSKSKMLTEFVDSPDVIYKHVYSLLKSFRFSFADIRGLGIHISKLNNQRQAIMSSDQCELNFERVKKSTEEKKIIQSEVKPHSNDIQKEDLSVNLEVFNELPSSVQQELTSNYNLKLKQKIATDELMPELPPWSQLDPSTLLALPNDLRDQILRAYGESNQPQSTVAVETDKLPSLRSNNKRKGTVSMQNKLKSSNTLTQLFSSKTDQSNILQDNDLPYDNEVWNVLPDDIRDELLEEYYKTKKQKNKHITAVTTATTTTTAAAVEAANTVQLATTTEPKLQGISELRELHKLFMEWVNQSDEAPEPEDVSTVCCYLLELIDYGDLEKTRLLVVYLRYLLRERQGEWLRYLNDIEESVNNAVISIYGCPLKF
ncbi:MAG: hypothetical protein EXX96DRAFT_537104 [Benjaminiella poitrasii]|nr:MAG: hypothetical protein EXX96DRAFT_537104 [Benjaminiella poitrasii]